MNALAAPYPVPAALRQQATPNWQQHASLLPEKNMSTAAATSHGSALSRFSISRRSLLFLPHPFCCGSSDTHVDCRRNRLSYTRRQQQQKSRWRTRRCKIHGIFFVVRHIERCLSKRILVWNFPHLLRGTGGNGLPTTTGCGLDSPNGIGSPRVMILRLGIIVLFVRKGEKGRRGGQGRALPPPCGGSTLGAGGLDGRVRHESGCCPAAPLTLPTSFASLVHRPARFLPPNCAIPAAPTRAFDP